MTYEKLLSEGNKIESAMEGTCFLYELDDQEYVVLSDNTVITRKEDNADGLEQAIFPYQDTANRYKVERKRRGTQPEVADLLQVRIATVSDRETGKQPISHEAWLALLSLPLK